MEFWRRPRAFYNTAGGLWKSRTCEGVSVAAFTFLSAICYLLSCAAHFPVCHASGWVHGRINGRMDGCCALLCRADFQFFILFLLLKPCVSPS